MKFKLGNRYIGDGEPVYFIAEIGINHCGSVKLAKNLIDVAFEAGANCVKFQKRSIKDCYTQEILDKPYNSINSYGDTYGEHKKVLELSNNDYIEIKKYADSKPISFIATPSDIQSVDFLESLNVPFYKIASGDITNLPLLKYIALKGKPMVISTGGVNMKVVEYVKNFVQKINSKIVFLVCTMSYPTNPEDAHINVISTFKNKFKNIIIGYSGHEIGTAITLASVAKGASVVERHVTLNHEMKGSDHKCSLNKIELNQIIKDINTIHISLGSGKKTNFICEKKFKEKLNKSIVAKVELKEGDYLTEDNITVKHPGTGISPLYYYDILGKKILKHIPPDKLLNFSDIDIDLKELLFL